MSHSVRKNICWVPQAPTSDNTGSLTVTVEAAAGLRFEAWVTGNVFVVVGVLTTAGVKAVRNFEVPDPKPGVGSYTFSGLQPNSYEVSLKAPTGYIVDDTFQMADVFLGQNTLVNFRSARPGSIAISLRTDPVAQSESFTFTIDPPAAGEDILTLKTSADGDGTASYTISGVFPGQYTITRTPDSKWLGATFMNVEVSGAETAMFDLTRSATLVIIKTIGNYNNNDGTFDFEIPGVAPVSITTDKGAGSATVTVPYNVKSVFEKPVPGWLPLDAQTLSLSLGVVNIVNFENIEYARLIITKTTHGGDGEFDFVLTGPTHIEPITVGTSGGSGTSSSSEILPGSYTLAESKKPGWQTADSMDFTANSGEAYTFEVTNYKYASVRVLKTITNYDGDKVQDGQFEFGGSFGTFSITTSAGTGAYVFDEVPPEKYIISETSSAGWLIPDPKGIIVGWGDSATLNFENTSAGTLLVIKTSYAGVGTFNFTYHNAAAGISGNFSLTTTAAGVNVFTAFLVPVGTYTVTENVPAGWQVHANALTVTVSHNQNSAVAFTNTKLAALTIRKQTTAGDGTFTIAYGVQDGPASIVSITTTGGVGEKTVYVAPGTYTITESAQAGWHNTSITPNSVVLDYGESTTVTVTNEPLTTITVHKNVIGRTFDGAFTFSVSPDINGVSTFEIVTSKSIGRHVFSDVPTNATTYTFTEETAYNGWTQDGPHSLTPSYGGDNSVTFNNSVPGAIQMSYTAGTGFTEGFSFDIDVKEDGFSIFTRHITATLDNGTISFDTPTSLLVDRPVGAYDIQVVVTGSATYAIAPQPPLAVKAGQTTLMDINFTPS